METPRERYFISNTLICLLKAVEGKVTTVELRDEKELTGRVDNVDGYMNVTMKNVTYRTRKGEKRFDSFFVNGKTICYVHIPDEIDMRRAMEGVLKRYNTREANLRVRKEIQDKAWEKMRRKHEAEARRLLQMDKQK